MNWRQIIKIGAWNACSILSKWDELHSFVAEYNIDILLLGETWLKPSHILKVPNFTVYRSDRVNGKGGGTAVAVRSHIKHHVIPEKVYLSLEATRIEICLEGLGPVHIVSVYQPSSRTFMAEDFLSLFDRDVPMVVVGDLNAKHSAWGCKTTTSAGRKLMHVSNIKGITVHSPMEPTYFRPGHTPDILDMALSRNFPRHISISSINDLSSDHNPVLVSMGGDLLEDPASRTKRTDWPGFTNEVSERVPLLNLDLSSASEVERVATSLSHIITDSLDSATTTRIRPSFSIPLPGHLKDLLRQKRKARKRANRSLCPADRRISNDITHHLRKALKENRFRSWQDKVSTLIPEDGSLWKMTKSLRAPSNRISHLNGTDGPVYKPLDKANLFADHLCTVFQGHPPGLSTEAQRNEAEVNDFDPAALNCDPDSLQKASMKEIYEIINRLKPKKAPGPDGITNTALRSLPPSAIWAMELLANAMLRHSYFPNVWKLADVVMIPKAGKDPTLPLNYRPISLLSSLSKVFEHIILGRLREELYVKDIIPPQQFGFREDHCCDFQLLRITEAARNALEMRDSTGAVFLDVATAFDAVWHSGLLLKMAKFEINPAVIKIVASYLEGRQFRVKYGGERSTWKPIAAGVPQGSLLAPDLFNVFTADIPSPPGVELALYADDTAIFSSCRDEAMLGARLQTATDRVSGWMNAWRMTINTSKCQVLRITNRRRPPPQPLVINGRAVPWGNRASYLGLTIDSRLTWNPHMALIKSRFFTSRNRLLPLLGKYSKLDLRTKLTIYKTVLRPQITYGALTWLNTSNTNKRDLEVLQNSTMRIITGAPWFVRNNQLRRDLSLESLEEHLRSLSNGTWERACASDNPLISDLTVDRDRRPLVRIRRPKDLLRPP